MPEDIKALAIGLERVFSNLMKDVPLFRVLDDEVLPYGLHQHTRSICWLAEQVILQNVKKRQAEYGVSEYINPESDISAWDACISIAGCAAPAFVNIKVSDVTRPARNNDIASVQKLLKFYKEKPNAALFYVVMMLEFDGNIIHFRKKPIVRYYPWIGKFVVNPRKPNADRRAGNTLFEKELFISNHIVLSAFIMRLVVSLNIVFGLIPIRLPSTVFVIGNPIRIATDFRTLTEKLFVIAR